MIKLKNISEGAVTIRHDSMVDLVMKPGGMYEFEDAVAEQLMVIHAPSLIKVIDVPLEYQDETEQGGKVIEQEVPQEVPEVPTMKDKVIKKVKKIVKKVKKGKK